MSGVLGNQRIELFGCDSWLEGYPKSVRCVNVVALPYPLPFMRISIGRPIDDDEYPGNQSHHAELEGHL